MIWVVVSLIIMIFVIIGLAELILRRRKRTGTVGRRRKKSIWQKIKESCCLDEG